MDVGGAVPTITASYTGLKNGDTAPAVLPTCSHDRDLGQPGGHLPVVLLGRQRPELLVHLRRRRRRRRHRRGDGDRQLAPRAPTATPPRRSRPATRASSTATPLRPPPRPARPRRRRRARSAATPRPARAQPIRTTRSSTSTAPSRSIRPPVVVTASSATVPFSERPAGHHRLVLGPGQRRHRSGDRARRARPPRPSSSAVGIYPSTCSGAADPNYTFSYVDGTITVTTGAVPVTVTASSATITYGDSVPAITASYTGFTGGQTDPATAADLHHHGDVVEPGRHLRDHLLGCRRSELRLRLRRRLDHDPAQGIGDGDGLVGHDDLRRHGPRDHPVLLGSGQRRHGSGHARRPARRRRRRRARSAPTRRPASARPIRTTPSARSTARST